MNKPRDALPVRHNDREEPLPPGHPLTWGSITDGTWLANCPYPYPDNTTKSEKAPK